MIKTLGTIGVLQGNILNTASILNSKKLNVFYPRSGIKQGCPLLLLKGMALEVLARVIWQENKIKGM